MRIALDTNVLVYAEGANGAERQDKAMAFLLQLPAQRTILPVQVLGELFNVLTRKDGQSPSAAQKALAIWQDAFPNLAETSGETMTMAVDLAKDHHLNIWDAVILSAASQAGCRLLASEDMQTGFTWGGVTVVDPFAKAPHPLLAALLTG